MGSHEGHAPQVVQPGLEVVPPEQRAKLDPYSDSDGPEAYSHGQFGNQNAQGRRNPFGLSPLAFGLLVGAVTAVIMSAALGGGIGGALASCQSQKSKLQASPLLTSAATASAGAAGALSSAVTAGFSSIQTSIPAASASRIATSAAAAATATDYAPVAIRQVDTLALDCPAIDGTTWRNHFNQDYKYTCGVDLGNLPSRDNGNITDIAAIIAYSVEDCIDACSAINFQTYLSASADATTCSSVSFFNQAAAVIGVGNGNCWLKKGRLAEGVSGKAADGSVSAQLV